MLVPLAIVALAAGACTAAPAATPEATRPVLTAPPLATAPPTSVPVTGEVPPEVMDAVRAQLADEVGAEAAAGAMVVQAEAVDWPDGSLGCPQPDMMYPQVITPGYQVVLEVDGKAYDYRASESGSVVLCDSGRPLGG